MRRMIMWSALALMVVAASSGCSRKQDQTSMTTSDSLLASNPVETPEAKLSPQTAYQEPAQTQQQQAPVSTGTTRTRTKPRPKPPASSGGSSAPVDNGVTLDAGTPIHVSVSSVVNSETANQGDTWTGEVKDAVIVGNTVVIPAGSTVQGVVTGVMPAVRGSRAYLVLDVQSVNVNGKSMPVEAHTDSIIAGSPRARNLGAIAGSAAAGALIGKAVGGSGKGAIIGGLIGGAAATGVVAKSKGYQVVIKEGTVMTFTVTRNVQMRS